MTAATQPTPSTSAADLRPSSILYAVVALVSITIAAIVGITIGNPKDPAPIIAAILGLVVPVIGGVMLLLTKMEQVHRLVNTRAEKQDANIANQDATIARLESLLRSQGGHTNGDPRPEPVTES